MIDGRIIKSTGSWYKVLTERGIIDSRLRGKYRLKGSKSTNPLAVGDYVIIELEDNEEESAIITELIERKNYVIRRSPKHKHKHHIIATNIDQAILMVTLSRPRTSVGFIDRFLVACESFRIPALLLFNKSDIMNEDDMELFEAMSDLYSDLGYPCILMSAHEDEDISPLFEILNDKTSLIAGHSGVGKSTLLNRLIPEADQKTSEISDFANKGTHTTTFAEMFFINEKSSIIDTPGIKELGLVDMDEYELSDYFPEMRELRLECKFNNCTHTNEPGCAVKAAIENGEVSESRYLSYLSIIEDEDNRR
ncbi:ribosome small subunit-dependent GTPase A [Marinigracilibium pacificum]|uniref:Small ribosomal subunit biogenesis GTPase RsgA n=1 Tax=Marinigracilibium pacificum TaxID=2729599 RepID=A0A848IVW2_9BACT|nr:ribosome small subunit-dependent GTPase A [Marinigracilibium pacificum]NMM48633.1 ribosome small subunit-dependent GTPase A [Marinigracilibium pacificum]